MQTKILTLLMWLVTNAATIFLLIGMALIAVASFRISVTVGLYTLGGLAIVLAGILFIPTERG